MKPDKDREVLSEVYPLKLTPTMYEDYRKLAAFNRRKMSEEMRIALEDRLNKIRGIEVNPPVLFLSDH